MDDTATNRWLAEQIGKVPGAELRTDGAYAKVWLVRYSPSGFLPLDWWLKPGTAKDYPAAQMHAGHRSWTPGEWRAIAALCVAIGTWLDHQPAPPERML